VLPPPPRVIPPAKPSSSVSAAPSHYPGSGSEAGPKNETARIGILPPPSAIAAAAPAVRMSKTQPLLAAPPAKVHSAPVSTIKPAIFPATAAPAAAPSSSIFEALDMVPTPVAAILCTISGVTLLIQIWNYFGS
jgi:hypothetical protein